jgi:hypothetical protein
LSGLLTFVGDVFLPRPVVVDVDLGCHVVFNLEYALTARSRGVPGKVNLRATENHLAATFGDRSLTACLANNHVMDFGEAGFQDTIIALDECGIGYFGAGDWPSACRNPLILDTHGGRVAVMGYACPSTSPILARGFAVGAAPLDVVSVEEDIRRARGRGAACVVVCLHWGAEEVWLPSPRDVVVARRIIDAGADLIVGHHAHRVQPYETYRGKYIFYGLGNCVMPDLDVPSHFDDGGRPTRRFEKTQEAWNRRSLAVSIACASGMVEVSSLTYQDGRLVAARTSHARRLPRGGPFGYARVFGLSYVLGKLQSRFMRFVRRPRIPTIWRLRRLWEDLRSSDPR